nr:MAG TPA: hypothetical protein [Caudoviricetes sp.]DAU64409.1 MAG TPA: hypothetical protein [Caudoviricetes sp.]DAZ07954.1 MAG TPA: hypothetical protein [Caudoviricetes sp.]
MKRLIHWIFRARKKQCRHCCLTCEYWDICIKDEGE